jgi:hypothetical protein
LGGFRLFVRFLTFFARLRGVFAHRFLFFFVVFLFQLGDEAADDGRAGERGHGAVFVAGAGAGAACERCRAQQRQQERGEGAFASHGDKLGRRSGRLEHRQGALGDPLPGARRVRGRLRQGWQGRKHGGTTG